ncbi:oxidoreductase [Leucobacter celer]|uniref:oxidoreductase n=1 Tax=Leucobacter celer TaxID=668625 RepID=UPI0006A7EDFA|nr:hypothetical protein [Leucobacter celer]
MPSPFLEPLTLPNGQVIANRIAKAAMEENLAASGQVPSAAHRELYRSWAGGGAGLVLTGNVMVAADHVTSPHGIVLDDKQDLTPFVTWARSSVSRTTQLWMQINHTGRLVRNDLGVTPLAPSSIGARGPAGFWAVPTAMSEADIERAIEQFATTAALAALAGFSGVQLHGAHGYLISQFLSPLSNQRSDRWGGDLAGRSRFLFETLRAVREALPLHTALGLKLNTADFQRGGFDQQDAAEIVSELNTAGLDLLEFSGGNAESPAMHGTGLPESSRQREAYFLELVGDLVGIAEMPLMLTGGVSSRRGVEQVLGSGIDMVGIGTALAAIPDLPLRWAHGEQRFSGPEHPVGASAPTRSSQKQAWVRAAMKSQSAGTGFDHSNIDLEACSRVDARRRELRIEQYRSWLSAR